MKRDSQVLVDEILFDARALQHRGRTDRRLADFDAALLLAMRHRGWPHPRPRLVGLVDPAAEPLPERHRLLFDEVDTRRRRPGRRSRWFVSPAPMAEDPVWALPILLDPDAFKVAIVHDLVSGERPDAHLTRLERRADHLTGLAWLRRYDLFAAGSHRVRTDLERSMSITHSRILVPGRAVRSGLEALPGALPIPFAERRRIAVPTAGSGRDDLETVVTAHARATVRHRLGLVLFGRCPPDRRGAIRTAYARAGGDQDALTFAGEPDPMELGELYRGALLTVVPSADSESALSAALDGTALGTPALVPEGAELPDAATPAASRYRPRDPDALARAFDTVSGDEALWESLRRAGLAAGRLHGAEAVARRCLDGLVERAGARPEAPAVGRGLRPRLAILTPLPPAASGAAARSAAVIEALARHVDVHAFSDTPGAAPGSALRSLAPVEAFDLAPERFDASLAVLGNARHHAGIVRALLDNGGAALAQDAHLVGFYAETFGLDRALDLGRAEWGRDLDRGRVGGWLRDRHDMPILFLSEVARAAAPLLVTSEVAEREIARLYGIAPKRLPVMQHRSLDRDLLAPDIRSRLRESDGWTRDEVVICASGLDGSAAAVVLWALRLLRDWRLDVRFALCGSTGDADGIERLVRELDLAGVVDSVPAGPSERERAERLAAADLAVVLETDRLSGPSGALLGAIAAALPAIANDHVARTAEAPAFVRRVPDALSPVLVAEAVLDVVASGQHRSRPLEEARAYAADHSPVRHAAALAEALGLDGGPA